MLVDTVHIVNVDPTYTFELNDVTSPFRDLDVTLPDRSNNTRYKQQAMGSWHTRSYEGAMNIHVEGALFADSSADYVVKRKTLMLALRGQAGTPVVDRRRGRIYLKFAGETERWWVDYGPLEVSMPVQGNYPSLTEYLITFGTFSAWFNGEDSNDKIYWS